MAEYQAAKAVSAGMIATLINECPLRAWRDSPFNPYRPEPERAAYFDIGSAAHLAVLEPDKFKDGVVEVCALNYQTKAAREARDEAYAAGKIPLLLKEFGLVARMVDAIQTDPDTRFLLSGKGDAEVSLFWDWGGVPCKARPDWLGKKDDGVILDLKTVASANPRAIARWAYNDAWHIRAAWYRNAITFIKYRVCRYVFVCVEKEPPHIVQHYELDPRALIWGEQAIVRGLRIFAECQKTGVWPSYAKGVQTLSLPVYAEHQLADIEQEWADNPLGGAI